MKSPLAKRLSIEKRCCISSGVIWGCFGGAQVHGDDDWGLELRDGKIRIARIFDG